MGQNWRRRVILAAAAVVAGLSPVAASAGGDDLAEVRRMTARFHRVEAAIEAGYQLGYNGLVTGCIAHPTNGAMGYHYFNARLFDDPSIDALLPEGLVYVPGPDGQLQLAAVEWVVPKTRWESAGNTAPPSVLGMDLHVLNPVLGWYIHHAWVWNHNPAGMFQDWNPTVSCS